MKKNFLVFAVIYSIIVTIISGQLSPNASNDSFNSNYNTSFKSVRLTNDIVEEDKSKASSITEKQIKEDVLDETSELEENNTINETEGIKCEISEINNNDVDTEDIKTEKISFIKGKDNILINFDKNAKNIIFVGNFRLSAYCHCVKCCDEYGFNRPVDENGELIVETATGTRAYENHTIAVDPEIIPYGSTVVIEQDGIFYEYVAEDCGGAIKNRRIDIYFDSHTLANEFGIKYGKVYIIKN